MSFLDAEVAQPYRSLMYSYPEEDARIDADAANRARQFSAQSAASRGSRSARGTAQNSYNRIMSDYTLGKAQNDRTNRLNYTNTMTGVLRSPGAVSPSMASTLGSVGGAVGGALLKSAAPDIWKRSKDALGWGNQQNPADAVAQYNALPSYYNSGVGTYDTGLGAGGADSWPDMAYYDLASGAGDWGTAAADAGSTAAGSFGEVDPEVFSGLFNSGFAGW